MLPHIGLTLKQPWELHKIEFPETKDYVKEDMESQNISSPVMNFRQLLEGPGDTPVVDEENFIFNTQEINRRIVASVRVLSIQAKNIEGSTIDEQRRVIELVTNKRIEDTIHNKKQGKNVTEVFIPDPPK